MLPYIVGVKKVQVHFCYSKLSLQRGSVRESHDRNLISVIWEPKMKQGWYVKFCKA